MAGSQGIDWANVHRQAETPKEKECFGKVCWCLFCFKEGAGCDPCEGCGGRDLERKGQGFCDRAMKD